MEFKELQKGKINEVERSILIEWQKQDILNRTITNRNNCTDWVFYDGPATANGMPGLHHMVAKFLKDAFCKYKTMKGYRVERKVGWDTHGLPTEVNVEKKLGLNVLASLPIVEGEYDGSKKSKKKRKKAKKEDNSVYGAITHAEGDAENKKSKKSKKKGR